MPFSGPKVGHASSGNDPDFGVDTLLGGKDGFVVVLASFFLVEVLPRLLFLVGFKFFFLLSPFVLECLDGASFLVLFRHFMVDFLVSIMPMRKNFSKNLAPYCSLTVVYTNFYL